MIEHVSALCLYNVFVYIDTQVDGMLSTLKTSSAIDLLVRILGPHPSDPVSSRGGGKFDLPRQYPAAIQVRVRTCAHADVHVHSPCHAPVHVDTCACAVACVHGPPFLRNRCQPILRGFLFLGSPHHGAVTPAEIPRVFVLVPPAQFPPSYEAVARINDARVFVFAPPQRNIAMTSL